MGNHIEGLIRIFSSFGRTQAFGGKRMNKHRFGSGWKVLQLAVIVECLLDQFEETQNVSRWLARTDRRSRTVIGRSRIQLESPFTRESPFPTD
jgi:hypothetical protein